VKSEIPYRFARDRENRTRRNSDLKVCALARDKDNAACARVMKLRERVHAFLSGVAVFLIVL
jgi:hypothetical protein